jgi:tRNA(Ile)-lysidine synthase
MIKIQDENSLIRRGVWVACSGGPDSMAVLAFLKNGTEQVRGAIFVDHGTANSANALKLVVEPYCVTNRIPLLVKSITRDKLPDESMEEYWRNERYKYLKAVAGWIVTGHNLDDCMETWLFNSIHGKPGIIPYNHANVIRPFMLNSKSELLNWCDRHGVPYYEDSSNHDTAYMRNYIRHNLMPHVLKVNPGFAKVIAKKVVEQDCYLG